MFRAVFVSCLVATIFLLCVAAAPAADQSGLNRNKLTHPEKTIEPLDQGQQTVKVTVNLIRPWNVLAKTDWRSRKSLSALRKEIHGRQQRVLDSFSRNELKLRHRFSNQTAFSAEVTSAGLHKLSNDPRVESIEPVFLLEPHVAQGIDLMNALATRSTNNGQGIAIAICDTGIDYSHPVLGNDSNFPNDKVIGGYDFGDNDSDPMPDGHAHGTCCAGIAAGDIASVGDYIGGVAYGAKLYALKISAGSSGSASSDDMAAAWDWCVTHQNDDPNNPIMVISTSFGGGRHFSSCDSAIPSMTTAAENAAAAGITLLVSSGNDGYCDSIGWPACISSVISVGAVYDASFGTYYPCISEDSCAPKTFDTGCSTSYYASDNTVADMVTSYSNTASFLDILAPSNRAYSPDISGDSGYSTGDYYSSFGGTSAACPYAAGVVAALQSAAKASVGDYLTPDEIRDRLTSTGDDVTDSKISITIPRVNLGEAMNIFMESPPVAQNGASKTQTDTPVTITLYATDDGLPDPPGTLAYLITSLPGHGVVSDPNDPNSIIDSVPYFLSGSEVIYTPDVSFTGSDSFQFKANDSGIAPDGGDSNTATVSISIFIYIATMDTNPGWTLDSQWQWGTPTGGGGYFGNPDPTTGYTGTTVLGYNLSGDYENSIASTRWATTPAINCTDRTGVTLSFYRWLSVEQPKYDHAYIQVSNNGSSWSEIWSNPSQITDSSWTLQTFDISAIADGQPTVYIRWGLGSTDSSWQYCGWNIDDVEITGDIIVTTPHTLTLSSTLGGSVITPGEGEYTYTHGTVVDVNAIADLNYHFVNWAGTGVDADKVANPISASTTVTIDADYTVHAVFAINTYTLDYIAGAGGSITGDTSQVVDYNGSGTAVTAVPDTGYHFVDWSDSSTDNPRTDPNVTANITVTANFAIDTFTLDYTAGAGGSITGNTSQVVNYNSNGTAVTAVPDTGFHFVDWSDGSTENPRTDMNVTANINVTATFAIATFTLEYVAGAGGSITGDTSQVVIYNNNGTVVTAVPDTGYHFVKWSDDVMTASRTDTNINANLTVTAIFAINPMVISGHLLEPDDATAIEGVLIETSTSVSSDVTDPNGSYELTVDYGWSGVIEPNAVGYLFDPNDTDRTLTNVTSNTILNLTGFLEAFIVSGYILNGDDVTPLEGVTVTPENGGGYYTAKYDSGGIDVTDANGIYEVFVDYNWSGKVVPSKYAYAFDPNGISYVNVIEDIVEAQNYAGTLLMYTITGIIKNPCELPIEGVLVEANNGSSDITDPNGNYEVWVDYNWSGTVTPIKENHTFDPNTVAYIDILGNIVDQGYIATNLYDLDCDGSIGLGDLAILCNHWLETGPTVPGDFYKSEDDIVDLLDLAAFSTVWGD